MFKEWGSVARLPICLLVNTFKRTPNRLGGMLHIILTVLLLLGYGGAAIAAPATPSAHALLTTLTRIAINPLTASVASGLTTRFNATGTYSNGTTANITSKVAWSSSNVAVATINSVTGYATGIVGGSSTITASAGGIVSDSAALTVTAPVLTAVSIDPLAVSVDSGLTTSFKVIGTYSNNSTADITSKVTWTSGSPSVAVIDSKTGIATAIAAGSSVITASVKSISSNSAVLTVNAPVVTAALSHWFANGLAGKKICMVGDSTTANATVLFSEFNAFYLKEGEALYGVAPILNFGENGASLTAYLWDVVAHGITATIAAQADLYVISYGINDVRLGYTSEDQLVSLLVLAVERILSAVPKADIVLRMPNSLLTSNVGGYNYVQPNSNAQLYSTILRNAYLRLVNRWKNVVVIDTQSLIFGSESLPSSIYMLDQLHPSSAGYVLLAKDLVDVIGQKFPYDPQLADAAVATDPITPYSVYPRVVEDPAYYDLVATGRWVASGAAETSNGYIDFTWPQSQYEAIHCDDVVQMATNHVFALPPTCMVTPLGENTRIYNLGSLLPPITMTGGTVNVWRRKQ